MISPSFLAKNGWRVIWNYVLGESKWLWSAIIAAKQQSVGCVHYIWVVGVSEGGKVPHSDSMSGVNYDSELDSPNCTPLLMMCVSQSIMHWTALLQRKICYLMNLFWGTSGCWEVPLFAGTLMGESLKLTDCQFFININCSSLLTYNYQYYWGHFQSK